MKKYKKIGKKNVRLTQSSLLLMQNINGNSETYKFPILETDNNPAPDPRELRLNMNDEFISYDVGYYLVASAVGENIGDALYYLPYAPVELNSVLNTYNKAWDGYLQILVNKISRLEKWDLKKHHIIPQTQFQSSSVGQPFATQPNLNYSEDGTFAMQPMITLSGAKKNDVIITLNGGAIPPGAPGLNATWQPPTGVPITIQIERVALFFRGMLAQNAAKFQ
jgi:hypothetical protein